MKNPTRRITSFLKSTNPIHHTILLAAVLLGLIVPISWPLYRMNHADLWLQIIAEMHVMVLDILVLGVLMVYINRLSEKRQRVESAERDIEDLRPLRGQYVRMKIQSCIKTLTHHGVHSIDLNRVHLHRARLAGVDLSGSDLNGFECSRGSLAEARLTGCTMNGIALIDTDCFATDFSQCVANGGNFEGSHLAKARFTGSKLIFSSFRRCNLSGADFSGAMLLGADFTDAYLLGVDFRGCKDVTLEQLRTARLVEGCLFDPSSPHGRARHPMRFDH